MQTRRFDSRDRPALNRLGGIAGALSWLVIALATGPEPLVAADNLAYNGGLVLTSPRLFIVYWGSDWQSGFTDGTSGLPSTVYQAYLEDFLNGVGGGSWIGTQSQYGNASSPPGVLQGKWTDAVNALPATPTQGQIEEEVRRAAEHFNVSSDPQAVYLIALPPGHGDSQFVPKGGSACAWHTRAWNNNIINVRFYPYITLPYMPDALKGCAKNAVNKGSDSSGHGIFDGVSKVAGHEWAETLTDPRIDAWYDVKGQETGDKCNDGPFSNIGAGGDYYAVQPLWSNSDGGCVLAGVPTADQSPAPYDFGAIVRYHSASPLTVQLANNGDLDLPLDLINSSPWYLTGANVSDFWLSGNTCGKTLHPGASCQVQANFQPTDFGTRQATLAVRVPLNVTFTGNVTPLSGDGISQWAILDPSTIVFVGVLVHSSAPPPELPISLKNTGLDPRHIQGVRIGGPQPSDFSVLGDGCSGHDLEPAGLADSCTVVLGFAPTATGERRAELEVTDATGDAFGVPVVGTGLGPVAQLSTSRLSFEDVLFSAGGGASGGEIPVEGDVLKSLTLTNTGQSPLEVQRVEVTGDFALDANGCSQPLPPDASCAIQVRLAPTHYQLQLGSLLIADNTSESPHEVELAGSVSAPLPSLVPDEVRFGPVTVGLTSRPQAVQLENLEGEAPLHIESIEATDDFTVTSSDCPSTLSIGRCTIMVALKPSVAGPREGMLVVTDSAPRSPQQVPLNGTGCGSGPEDSAPPRISSVSASPNRLWPPNHKLVPVAISVSVADTCDPNPSCAISSVSSNEPIEPGSVQVTGPLSVTLRAERLGAGSGRVYTVAVTCTDALQNSFSATTTVTVPHDQGH